MENVLGNFLYPADIIVLMVYATKKTSFGFSFIWDNKLVIDIIAGVSLFMAAMQQVFTISRPTYAYLLVGLIVFTVFNRLGWFIEEQ